MEGLSSVALFGGSFNPPHAGHAEVLRHLVNLKESGKPRFDEVWLLLTHVHPFGKDLLDFPTRRKLCELLIRDIGADGARIKFSDIEAKLAGETRTVKTIRELKRLYPKTVFTLVLGADLMQQTGQWLEFDEIERLVEILYVPRRGFERENDSIGQKPFAPKLSSTEVRETLGINHPLKEELTPSVAAYIRQHHLYEKGSA